LFNLCNAWELPMQGFQGKTTQLRERIEYERKAVPAVLESLIGLQQELFNIANQDSRLQN
jgi:hypothetical protein